MAIINGHTTTMDHAVEHRVSQEQSKLVIHGITYNRIPHDRREPCACFAAQGELHHIGCKLEICPHCQWLLAVCDCVNGG